MYRKLLMKLLLFGAFVVLITGGEGAIAQSSSSTARPGGDLPGNPEIHLVHVAGDFVDPVNVVAPPGEDDRLFVVERPGTVRIVQDGDVLEQPFLDISRDVLSVFLEQGLYDIAFHPDFEENGQVFVHYSEMMRNGDSMIVRYRVSDDNPDRIDPSTARPILQIDQPWANHNGGELAFGPDGYLYIGSGDGGWEGDPLGAGQDLSTLLGKILRIDVDTDGDRPYRIPGDNPFAQNLQEIKLFGVGEPEFARLHTDARPEIWAYGLRNPWKFNFDPETGDLYIADVGQNHWEEINFQPAGSEGGENYGWDHLMGTHPFPIQAKKTPDVGVPPAAEYEHESEGICVVGLGVYREENQPSLNGVYFAGDWGSGKIFGLARGENDDWVFERLLDTKVQITGAGQTATGEIYVTSAGANYQGPIDPADNPRGSLWKLVAADEVPADARTVPLDE